VRDLDVLALARDDVSRLIAAGRDAEAEALLPRSDGLDGLGRLGAESADAVEPGPG
jgi:hypothetical protein